MARREMKLQRLTLPFREEDAPICTVSAPLTHKKGAFQEHCIDFLLPEGTPIYPASPGKVILCQSGNRKYCFDQKYSYEKVNAVILLHDNAVATVYLHLMDIYVNFGDFVTPQEKIGTSGMTGFASYPHLHFGLNTYDSKGILGILGNSISIQFREILPHPISWIEATKKSNVPLKIIIELECALGGTPSRSTSINSHLLAVEKLIDSLN